MPTIGAGRDDRIDFDARARYDVVDGCDATDPSPNGNIMRPTHLVTLAAALALATTARATIIYGDGQAHSVSTALGDSVIVRAESSLSVLPGASIVDLGASAALVAADSGPVTISGGSIIASGPVHLGLQFASDAPLSITGGTFSGGPGITGGPAGASLYYTPLGPHAAGAVSGGSFLTPWFVDVRGGGTLDVLGALALSGGDSGGPAPGLGSWRIVGTLADGEAIAVTAFAPAGYGPHLDPGAGGVRFGAATFPEPPSAVLLGLGLAAVLAVKARRPARGRA
jgi:hypothetical protein